jgi:hypothetical protein
LSQSQNNCPFPGSKKLKKPFSGSKKLKEAQRNPKKLKDSNLVLSKHSSKRFKLHFYRNGSKTFEPLWLKIEV